jgi:tetratricopeptide (TPR) repeat protein
MRKFFMLSIRFRRTAVLWALALFLLGLAPAQSQTGDSFPSLVQEANSAREAGKAEEAIRDYGRALALRPDWAEGWWDLGMTQYETNNYVDAETSFRKLAELAPKAASGWSMLGLAEFETKDYSTALASLEKAQRLGGIDDPEIARVSAYHLALLLIRNGEFERATTLLHSAFRESLPAQVKTALGLALLRVPLLPSDVDPSQDALILEAGDAAASPDQLQALFAVTRQYPNVPWLHYTYGLALAAAGQTQEALEEQKLESGISSTSALPWVEISILALHLKQTPGALSAARRAVALDGESSEAHDALAKALATSGKAQAAALEAHEAARLPQRSSRSDSRMVALYGARSASGAVPENADAWVAAMQEYSARRYPETIAALTNWVERNPSDGTAWAVMGLSEYALKEYDNARIHLQRGINLGLKGSAESLQLASDRLALLLIRDGQFEAATALLRPVAKRPPMAQEIQLALGLALLRVPTMPEDLDPPRRDLAQSAGAIVELLLVSRYAEAFPEFQKLIAERPATPWLHYAYGDALASLSHYDEAKEEMRAEAKVSPGSALPWIRIASIDVRQHLPEEALKAAQSAVALAPDSAEAHYELGRAWLENGDAQKAIEALGKASGIKPDNPEIHFVLARAYAKANQPEKAAAERAAFMRLKAATEQQSASAAQGESILQTNPQ